MLWLIATVQSAALAAPPPPPAAITALPLPLPLPTSVLPLPLPLPAPASAPFFLQPTNASTRARRIVFFISRLVSQLAIDRAPIDPEDARRARHVPRAL